MCDDADVSFVDKNDSSKTCQEVQLWDMSLQLSSDQTDRERIICIKQGCRFHSRSLISIYEA